MLRMNIPVLLMIIFTGCSDRPQSTVRMDPRPSPEVRKKPVRARRESNTPVSAAYPGGLVTFDNNVIRSVGTGRSSGNSPQNRLAAMRAAYLIAIRNAGLFMSGLRVDANGHARDVGQRMLVANVRVSDFREVDSSFDPATGTAKVTIEIRTEK